MSEPFIGEIKIWAGNFAPRNWAFCNGQLLPVSQNTALFSIIGTTYGGDGRSTFGLPNLQGRAPMHAGRGPGLSSYKLGQTGGIETETLTANEMPDHNHSLTAFGRRGDLADPTGRSLAGSSGGNVYHAADTAVPMNAQALGNTGGSQPHDNLQPYLTLNFVIALQGIYPQRS